MKHIFSIFVIIFCSAVVLLIGCSENSRMDYIDPRQGIETCGIVEQMSSDLFLVRITGNPSWADNCEDVAFNSYPAAFMPDFKALRYITSPNQVISDSKNHSPGIQNSGPFMAMNPFSSRCCQHNHTHGLPYYVEHLWLATPDNGLAAVLYNACTINAKVADGTEISITETTNYPFEEQVQLKITVPKTIEFPLYFRVPKWCDNMQIAVNDQNIEWNKQNKPKPQQYVRLHRQWNNGDTITIKLPMRLALRVWQQNKGCVSIDYGPLTFSLKIKERYEQRNSTETAIGDSRWQQGADPQKWHTYEIYPDSDWNYGLTELQTLMATKIIRKEFPADLYPWTTDAVPITLKAQGRKIPEWKVDQYGLCAPVPQSPVKTTEPVEELELIPMGAARLRISAFPFTEK